MSSKFSLEELFSHLPYEIENPELLQKKDSSSFFVHSIQDLKFSNSESICFCSQKWMLDDLKTFPRVLGVKKNLVEFLKPHALWKETLVLSFKDPYVALAKASIAVSKNQSTVFHGESVQEGFIHSTAQVHPEAQVSSQARVSEFVVIEKGAQIGNGVILYPHVYIGPNARVGENTVCFSGVKIYEDTVIGKSCRIHSNCVLGSDGFGYAQNFSSDGKITHEKIYHLGKVTLGDRVEMGAGSTIDRGTLSDTKIGNDVKIDNQVQIGHNVEVGEGAILCGKVGLAGSCKIGRFAMLGGEAGVGNKVVIGDFAQIAGGSKVGTDVPANAKYMGYPAMEAKNFMKMMRMMSKFLRSKESMS